MKIVLIAGDARTTKLCQALDVFETFKVFGHVSMLDIALKEGATLTNTIMDICRLAENEGLLVSAIFAPGNPEGAWRNEAVKVISDGQKCELLDDVLAWSGYSLNGKETAACQLAG